MSQDNYMCHAAPQTTICRKNYNECDNGPAPGLDTSPNATFHQYSLYWQHPNLPWLELFPRNKVSKVDFATKQPLLTAYPHVRDNLHRDWSESFRSLLQLLRARLCPYFYVMANSFNCVFHASGVNGCTQTTALVNPTTRGFRKLLSSDGVNFTMPLRKNKKRVSEELGDDDVDDEESEAQAEASDWLASMGVDAEEIKKMNNSEVRRLTFYNSYSSLSLQKLRIHLSISPKLDHLFFH
ncbi:unnamed protein product [Nesidiocoris tenuis]|uniref:Uncharacterized protein n=1 Tax=Nesidiocoris tenuis TaxID=355587 RepID=A0A6H5G804_9HEMI|nr:unnamed protein product [Nesidiocoris tenuis]